MFSYFLWAKNFKAPENPKLGNAFQRNKIDKET